MSDPSSSADVRESEEREPVEFGEAGARQRSWRSSTAPLVGGGAAVGANMDETLARAGATRSFTGRSSLLVAQPEQRSAPIATAGEVRGWLLYDAANGAFFYGFLNFIQIVILSQARETAHQASCAAAIDWPGPRVFTSQCGCQDESAASMMNAWCQCLCRPDEVWEKLDQGDAGRVPFFGLMVQYSSVYACATTISVIIQTVIFMSFSSVADYGNLRRSMLLACTLLGSLCCILVDVFGSGEDSYMLNCVLFVLANASFGFAVVFYNAFLPLIAASLPEVRAIEDFEEMEAAADRNEARLSGKGVQCGMAGQMVFLIGSGLAGVKLGLSATALCAIAGWWNVLLGTYAILSLDQRPGRELPQGESYLGVSVKGLRGTFQKAKDLKQLFLYLFAYFVFSDGCSTVASQAATLAQKELGATQSDVIAAVLVLSLFAIIGALVLFRLQVACNLRPNRILITVLFLEMFTPMYALMAHGVTDLFLIAIVFGALTGPQQAYTRSIFASLIPRGHEAEFFGFYEITDKSTAFLGPVVVASVVTATGSYRHGFACLFVFFLGGVLVLVNFKPEQAERERKAFEEAEANKRHASIAMTPVLSLAEKSPGV